MTDDRSMSDIDLPETAGTTPDDSFPAGKGPQARTVASDHPRPQRLGHVVELVPLDLIDITMLVRDRIKGPDFELGELKSSIAELGLSNPIRIEARDDGRFELIQGYRRLSAFRALLEETGDTDSYGAIPAAVSQPGDDLESLYRRMVDENLVRKDISFAEMAMLALDYAADPGTLVNDPEKAVAILFKSTGYQKRSYIRTFMTVVQRLGGDLRFPQDIPRALGLALARRLDEVEGLVPMIRAELKGRENRSVVEELAVLRRFAGDPPEFGTDQPQPARLLARPVRPVTATTSFQFDHHDGRTRCLAAVGKLEIQLDRDFSTIDRRRLEQAIRLMLDQLDR